MTIKNFFFSTATDIVYIIMGDDNNNMDDLLNKNI